MWDFVVPQSSLGTISREGPVTGRTWTIGPLGGWIDARDAEVLCRETFKRWCPARRAMTSVPVLSRATPTADRILDMPEEEIEVAIRRKARKKPKKIKARGIEKTGGPAPKKDALPAIRNEQPSIKEET